MNEIYLPTLHTFAMDNIFTGSKGDFRFRIVPQVVKLNQKEVNFDESTIFAQYWHGPSAMKRAPWKGRTPFL